MTDLATLSETQRQGEATRAALGVQTRVRPLWSGADRFTGIPTRYVRPYRMRGVNSPENVYENIVHDGTVYAAEIVNAIGACIYTSTDLKAWTGRSAASTNVVITGRIAAAPSLLVHVSTDSGNSFLQTSTDHGVSWVNQGYCATGDVFKSAGGVVYYLGMLATSGFRTMTAAKPAGVERNFLTAQLWRSVLHNGARTLALSSNCAVGEWSANGLDNWNKAAGMSAALAEMPGTGISRRGYVVGSRFVIITMAEGAISSVFSDDANAWSVGAMGEVDPSGLAVIDMADSAAILNGVLHIPVKLTDGTNNWHALLATPDGVKFKWLPAFYKASGNTYLPSIRARIDGSALIFNAARNQGIGIAARYENNPEAQEVYLAV